jgi:hypothetical protein
MTKNIMISQPLNWIGDVAEYVEHCKKLVKEKYPEYNILDTFFPEFSSDVQFHRPHSKRCLFMALSISRGLAMADLVVFCDNWDDFKGCCIENIICKEYEIPFTYLDTGRGPR